MTSNLLVHHIEIVKRLALGIEPIDALRQQRILFPLQVEFNDSTLNQQRPPFQKYLSNRFVIFYDDYFTAAARTVNLRLFDAQSTQYLVEEDLRRYVPRKLRISVKKLRGLQINRVPIILEGGEWE
jgi:hypothetical protein